MTVSALCQRTGMSRQNYYYGRKQRQRRQMDGELVLALVKAERQIQPRLGTRKLHWMLKPEWEKAGIRMGRDKFFELLRQADALIKPLAKGQVRTTQSRHCLPIFQNKIKEMEVTQPNQVWVADLTYLATWEGHVYVPLVTDKASRKIVGYECADTLETEGCLGALEMALKELPLGAQPIHHSDRGCQYCSHEYVGRLQERGLSVSMTETNHSAENALAERVNGIIKNEYGLGQMFQSKEQARRCVAEAIHLYNTRRPHMSLGYKVPAEVHSVAA